MPVPDVIHGIRIVAEPTAIDRMVWPEGTQPVRIAPDDVFVIGAAVVEVDDVHAIVEPESMFAGLWIDRSFAVEWVQHNAEWLLPDHDGVAQGMVAALPVKILVDGDRALVMVPVSLAHELEARL